MHSTASFFCSEFQQNAHQRGDADEHDGVPFLYHRHPVGTHQQHRRQRDGRPVQGGEAGHAAVQQGDGHHGDARRRHQSGGGRAQAVERCVDPLAIAEGLQERRHDENDDDGGRYQAEGGHQRAADAAGGEAHIGGHVHADRPRRGLRHRQHIRQLRVGEPAGAVGHILQEG